jgi:tRNA1Val (adenine37-N6)-methyltransferase
MKVTTDACILGAWTPLLPGVKRVLDIGAGTGLLSLMLAQRNPGIIIDAIEFEHNAAIQAKENVHTSPWKNRINIVHGDVRDYATDTRYDLIISNPPFFVNSLLSDDAAKNMARHASTITFNDLLHSLNAHLNEDGYAAILLPAPEYNTWKQLLKENGWSEFNRLPVKHRPDAPVKRVIGLFTRKQTDGSEEETLTIYDSDNRYTERFKELMSPFYLYL